MDWGAAGIQLVAPPRGRRGDRSRKDGRRQRVLLVGWVWGEPRQVRTAAFIFYHRLSVEGGLPEARVATTAGQVGGSIGRENNEEKDARGTSCPDTKMWYMFSLGLKTAQSIRSKVRAAGETDLLQAFSRGGLPAS